MLNYFKLNDVGLSKRKRPNGFANDLRFDEDTFIYDIIYNQGKLVIICPPLTSEAVNFILNNLLINNKKLLYYKYKSYFGSMVCKFILDVSMISEIKFHNKLLVVLKNSIANYNIDASRVLYTMQKNNSFEHINDWVDYYCYYHKPTAIIIYDNNSDRYTIEELNLFLKSKPCLCVVVPFNFNYGEYPYNYCQFAAFEHIRYSLSNPEILMNVDIDELVVTNKHNSLFDMFASMRYHFATIKGRYAFIDDVKKTKNIFHSSHDLSEFVATSAPKYIVKLNKLEDIHLLGVHDISYYSKPFIKGLDGVSIYKKITSWLYKKIVYGFIIREINKSNSMVLTNVKFYHCMQVTTRKNRSGFVDYDSKKYYYNELSVLFERIKMK